VRFRPEKPVPTKQSRNRKKKRWRTEHRNGKYGALRSIWTSLGDGGSGACDRSSFIPCPIRFDQMLFTWQHHVHNPMGPKKPAPFALNLPLSAHNENTAAGDATMPSTQPEVHSHQAGQAQAKTLRRPYHRAKAREIADSGSAPLASSPGKSSKLPP